MKSPLLPVSNRPPRWCGGERGRRRGTEEEAVAGLGCLVPEKRRPGPTEAMGPIPTTYIRQQPTHATRLSVSRRGSSPSLPPTPAAADREHGRRPRHVSRRPHLQEQEHPPTPRRETPCLQRRSPRTHGAATPLQHPRCRSTLPPPRNLLFQATCATYGLCWI